MTDSDSIDAEPDERLSEHDSIRSLRTPLHSTGPSPTTAGTGRGSIAAEPAQRFNELTDGPIGRALWQLAVPLSFGFVINAVYSWINMYFVSRLGDSAMAAIGFADQINMLLFTIGSGYCIGTGIIVARRIGERRFKAASVIGTQAFSFMAVYATLAAAALHFVLPPVLPLLNLHGQMLENTQTYLLTVIIGLPANLLMFQANCSLRSSGNTMFPMMVAIMCAAINAVLDPLLIFGLAGLPKLGLQGAAIATSIAQWIGAAVCTFALYSGKLNFRLYRPTLRVDWAIIGNIFRLGVASSLQTLAVSVSRLVLISVVSIFGTAAVAAYAIGLRIDILVMMPIYATGIAIETLVSQNIGAGRFDRVQKFRARAVRDLCCLVAVMGIVVYLFAAKIAGVFTDNPAVVNVTVHYLHFAVFGYLFLVVGQNALRSLSGAGHPLRSLRIVGIVLVLVQIPLAYLLAMFTPLHETGLFAGITLSMLVLAVAGSYSVRGTEWMMKKV